MMKAVNRTSGSVLAGELTVADALLKRMKGLLGRRSLERGEGLWITPCNGVHTFGMSFPIDVLFLDRDHRVVAVSYSLSPSRLTRIHFKAKSVLELPAGTAEQTATKIGDLITID